MPEKNWYIYAEDITAVNLPFTVSFHSECEYCDFTSPGLRVNLRGYEYYDHNIDEDDELIPIDESNVIIVVESEEVTIADEHEEYVENRSTIMDEQE